MGSNGAYADEDVLVAALLDGDEAAFAFLLDRYDAPLRRLATTFVSTPAAAEEVVQETWLAVIEGLDRFEGRAALKTWIYRILMNKARTRGVRDKRSIPFASLGPTFPADRFLPADHPTWPGHWASPPASWDSVPHELVESREALDRVRAAIASLPSPHRQVITLRDVEGWSAAEVCTALELTAANQRVLLHRARAKVRATLESYFEEVAP